MGFPRFARALMVALGVLAVSAGTASAAINLEWRPSFVSVPVGSSFSIGLYAVSDDASNQSMASVDAIMNWTPSVLKLTGITNNSPYSWISSNFPDDCSLDGLNANPVCPSYTGLTANDGTAYYRSFRNFTNPAFATPAGLLVATFNFDALVENPSTMLDIPASAGSFTRSFVQDGFVAGLEVTGGLGSAKIEVTPEPASITLAGLCLLGVVRRRVR
jgi:hypothetical protein